MSSDFALNIDQVAKTYHLYDTPKDRLKQILSRGKRQYYREYQALKPLSFTLPKGEVLGVVGRNGAGKSTLLQLICGTLTPSSGHIQVQGRIAALLELGAGFNPQFTGRENIYLSASIMGISRQEIDAKVEGIIDFAGVRNFIDQPVSTYSSGMYVRLAFSVATSVEPDILIIDEALSVGDGDFARRSFERIMTMKDKGATIIFCSHSLYQIEVLCSQAIWIERGQLVKMGEPATLISEYQNFLDLLSSHPDATPADVLQPKVTEAETERSLPQGEYARIVKVEAHTPHAKGERLDIISSQTDLTLDISFVSTLKNEIPQVAIAIHNAAGQLISSAGAWTSGIKPTVNSEGQGKLTLTLPALPLLQGTYYVGVLLFCERGVFLHDEADPVVTLDVTQTNHERGIVMLPHHWQVTTPKDRIKIDAAVTKRQPTDRWLTRPANAEDLEQLKSVYRNAFEQELNEEVWRWKYRETDSPGFVVQEGEQIVAFCGGAPRKGLVKGQSATFCQIGDVMVDTHQRGILTKTGPFYRCVYPFMGETIGKGHVMTFAFGFPNYRHLRVGERHRLYAKFDRILEAEWPPKSGAYLYTAWHGETELGDKIDRLWQRMRTHLNDYLVGLHDQAWLRYRYLEKPHDQYLVNIVSLPSAPHDPIGVIVLKDHPDAEQMELLDFISEPQHSHHLIRAAQHMVAERQRQRLYAWLTPNVYTWLTETDGYTQETDIVIPGNGLDNPEHTAIAINRWWLMGGDSDFR